jgi:hypothetical protein
MLRSAGIVLERAREINSACKTISGEFLERISTTGSKRNANCSCAQTPTKVDRLERLIMARTRTSSDRSVWGL